MSGILSTGVFLDFDLGYRMVKALMFFREDPMGNYAEPFFSFHHTPEIGKEVILVCDIFVPVTDIMYPVFSH